MNGSEQRRIKMKYAALIIVTLCASLTIHTAILNAIHSPIIDTCKENGWISSVCLWGN